jgi:DNA polymerase I-like protein with 3'-5' exonuclease and polymerase domains
MVLCGADMVSLEDTTKRHYMVPFDPEYVKEMCQEGFDPHLDLAAFAGAITREQVEQHKEGKINLKAIRSQYKAANYSCVYGVGKTKLARTLGISLKEAAKLIEDYWKRNFSVRKAVEKFEMKTVGPYMWVKNPVSGFWHNLRSEKDAFSTVNQSTGVYAFDTWLYFVRKQGVVKRLEMHDEIGFYLPKGEEAKYEALLKGAISKANDKLKLNVLLYIDVQFGRSYAETH